MPTTISGTTGVDNVAPDSINFEDLKNTLFNGLLGVNGYIKIPVNDQGVVRDLIVQWVTGVSATAGSVTGGNQVLTFPIDFPNGIFFMVGDITQTSGARMYATTQFSSLSQGIVHYTNPSSSGSATGTPRLIAFGY